jgi:hypothetical protein
MQIQAAPHPEVRDRSRVEQGALERLDRADVGLAGAGRTSTPIPEREMSVRVAATRVPSMIHRSIGADPLMSTSKASPALMRFSKSAGSPLETLRL